jgi:hypothetical protein
MTSYVKQLGYGSLTIVNVSPVIKGSKTKQDDFPDDALNLYFISQALRAADLIIIGWGKKGKYGVRHIGQSLQSLLIEQQSKLRMFGCSSDGTYPKHPCPPNPRYRYTLESELVPVSVQQIIRFTEH